MLCSRQTAEWTATKRDGPAARAGPRTPYVNPRGNYSVEYHDQWWPAEFYSDTDLGTNYMFAVDGSTEHVPHEQLQNRVG